MKRSWLLIEYVCFSKRHFSVRVSIAKSLGRYRMYSFKKLLRLNLMIFTFPGPYQWSMINGGTVNLFRYISLGFVEQTLFYENLCSEIYQPLAVIRIDFHVLGISSAAIHMRPMEVKLLPFARQLCSNYMSSNYQI